MRFDDSVMDILDLVGSFVMVIVQHLDSSLYSNLMGNNTLIVIICICSDGLFLSIGMMRERRRKACRCGGYFGIGYEDIEPRLFEH